MRLRKPKLDNINWKYILGEIFLIFVGINLAVWFNNWNTSRTVNKNKVQAIQKIEGEIQTNLEELLISREENRIIPRFIESYQALPTDAQGRVLMTAAEMEEFKSSYANFFKSIDSIKSTNQLYAYTFDTYINLEIATLSKIAWETSKSTGIFNEFEFDCLYGLESMYNLQGLVKKEYGNALDALQKENIGKLLRVLIFIDQLDRQLEAGYTDMLVTLESCN